jgi:hypothetical protein
VVDKKRNSDKQKGSNKADLKRKPAEAVAGSDKKRKKKDEDEDEEEALKKFCELDEEQQQKILG